MKTSVSSYSFGDYFHEDGLGVFGCIDKAAELGFDGFDFLDGPYLDEKDMPERIREHAEARGIEVYGMTTKGDFIAGSNGILKDEVTRICRRIDLAARLGIQVVRHSVGNGFYDGRTHSRGYDDALPYFAEGCREVTKYAESKGIRTCTENHGKFHQDALRVEKLINTVAHDNFGALLDCGNFVGVDEDPTYAVGILAPYTFHVHVKDFHIKPGTEIFPGEGWSYSRGGNYYRPAIIGHGEAKIYQSIQILKRSGYDGFMTIEFGGIEDSLKGIAMSLANLKRFIAE